MENLFNLDKNSLGYSGTKKSRYLIIYDIVSNKRRTKFSKLLEGYGIRVQRSCFEVYLSKSNCKKMKKEIIEFYSKNELDNIIIYPIDNQDVKRLNSDQIEFIEDIIFI